MQQTQSPAERPAGRFFYGYIMIIAAFFILLAYSASRTVYGIFFDPMIEQFKWSAALLSGAFSLSIVMDGLSGILWGRLTDRLGPRKVLFVSGIMAGAGYILMALVSNVWQLYLIYGLLIGAGMGGLFVPMSTTIPRWFIARRNLANGLSMVGMGIGTLIISPIAYWLVSKYNWPLSYVIIGSFFLLIILVSTIFLRSDPSQVGQKPYTGTGSSHKNFPAAVREYSLPEAMRTPQMWLAFMMFFCFGFSGLSMMVHLVPHIINIEISAATAASVLAVVGAINVFGRLFFGLIGDRLGSLQSYLLGLIIIMIGLIWLIFIEQVWMLYAFAVLWGLSAGGIGSVHTSIVAELFGVKSLGVIFGVCGLGAMIGGSIGPVITGYLFDLQGNYQIAFLTCAVIALVGIILNLWLTGRRRRMKKLSAKIA